METSLSTKRLTRVLERLANLRLVRATVDGYEIAHDYLAKVVVDQLSPDEAEARRYKAILAATAATYEEAESMLSMPEHLRVYKLRDRIHCSQDEVKLLFASYLHGNGPVHFWLRHEQLSKVWTWAAAYAGSQDADVARSAIRFVFKSGGEVSVERASKLLSKYVYGEELAAIVRRRAKKEDIPLLLRIASRTRNTHLENECVDTAARLLADVEEHEIRLIATSRRAVAELTMDVYSQTVGLKAPLRVLRSIALTTGDWRRNIAISVLGVRGKKPDIELLSGIAEQERLSLRLRASASAAVDTLRWKFCRSEVIREAVRSSDPTRAIASVSSADGPTKGLNVRFLLRLSEHKEPLSDDVDLALDVARRIAARRDLPQLRARLRSSKEVDPPMRHLILAICDLGGPSDFDFILSVFRKPGKPMKLWYIGEIADAIARLAERRHVALLDYLVSRSEFWVYSSAPFVHAGESIMEKFDAAAANVEDSYKDRVYYTKRIIIAAFCHLAGRRQMGRLIEMLDHDYWIARMAASDALVRLAGVDDLPAFLELALSTRKHHDALIQLLCRLDEKLVRRETEK
jgi:hypothetical protein